MSSESGPSSSEALAPCERMLELREVRIKAEPQDPRSDLKEFYGGILKSGKHADIKISVAAGDELHAHKAIVCASCESIRQAVEKMEEEDSSSIEICYRSSAVKALLQYLYTRDYGADDNPTGLPEPFFHFEVYVLAMEHKVDGLNHLALSRFQDEVRSKHWSGGAICLLVGQLYESLPESPHEMRDIVCHYCATHMATLLQNSSFAEEVAANAKFRADISNARSKMENRILEFPCSWRPAHSKR